MLLVEVGDLFLFCFDLNYCLEATHYFFCGGLARCVSFDLVGDLLPESDFSTAGLTPLQIVLVEGRGMRQNLGDVFKLIGVVASVVPTASVFVIVVAKTDEQTRGRDVAFAIDVHELIVLVHRHNDIACLLELKFRLLAKLVSITSRFANLIGGLIQQMEFQLGVVFIDRFPSTVPGPSRIVRVGPLRSHGVGPRIEVGCLYAQKLILEILDQNVSNGFHRIFKGFDLLLITLISL